MMSAERMNAYEKNKRSLPHRFVTVGQLGYCNPERGAFPDVEVQHGG